ncbi:site-2 protease family protein [Sporomusa acidovorans]|uniref:ApaG domain-containing protein n=1 Tax=Sporomusa acidovorans (strain ATCC 49682 / DSM 3132 / Mol) TaxID=1123286 RepID=A0ABZ3J6Y0_SPOA4|nr:site-2 protease family protein [Sporomusa acidovorans]OZC23459.1 peptidase family M50 [Sporomusa acidovorans DSM 3132]SDF27490.1 Zn-dependent protease (includes SpoIVFB) [Sporomusa acidovorans]
MRHWRVINLGRRVLRRAGIGIVGLLALIQVGGVLSTAASMLVSLAVYALAFGVKFAVGFILLLLIHELGHIAASRIVGLKAKGPTFIPFIGAVISLNRPPVNAKMTANIAIGGPAAGTLSALICLAFYLWSGSMLMLVLAYTACLLNIFNLIPCAPLDGERIAAAISPRIWWIGSFVIGAVFVYTYNILVLIIFLFSLFELWRGGEEQEYGYYQLTAAQRLQVAWWYFGLLSVLGVTTLYTLELLK